ncbi:hypothetical protein [Massilia niastensis]|uniref:hypothetical protein n=1 Tax=Massilia niastensis TaxID=544911 RepID=UPI0012EBBB2F|nr:hypothetical protein [Massilia niastensis]
MAVVALFNNMQRGPINHYCCYTARTISLTLTNQAQRKYIEKPDSCHPGPESPAEMNEQKLCQSTLPRQIIEMVAFNFCLV